MGKMLLSNFSMRAKLIASFSGVLFIFLAVALFNLHQVTQIKQHMTEQNDKVELKVLALELKNLVQEMNIIASGLEISKKPEFIEKYNSKRQPYNDSIKKIGDTASTPDQQKWRSQLIQASVDYINNFDSAAKMVQDTSMKPTDLQINLLYLYSESQELKDNIFGLVDKFYITYADGAAAAIADSSKALNNSRTIMLIASAFVFFLTLVIAFLIITSFTRPISVLQRAVARIASGDLTHTINSSAKDELGQLSNNFDQMIRQVRLMLGATKGIASSLSAHSHEFHRFSQLTASANSDILKAIHEISTGADEQAMKTESSSMLIAELEEEIRDINAYTHEMKRSSDAAALDTQQGTASVQALKASTAQSQLLLQKVDAAMQTLSASSKQIGAIVRSIMEISTQTNVLALNAAIEAARAGAHGRGFSVIAEEVRELSLQTNGSSKTISGIIGTLQGQIQELQLSLVDARESALTQSSHVEMTFGSFSRIEQSTLVIREQIVQIHQKIEQAQSKNDLLIDSVQFVAAIAQETAAGVEEVNSTSIQQDASIRRIAEESDDILELAQQLFEEISKFQIVEDVREDEIAEVEISSTEDPIVEQIVEQIAAIEQELNVEHTAEPKRDAPQQQQQQQEHKDEEQRQEKKELVGVK